MNTPEYADFSTKFKLRLQSETHASKMASHNVEALMEDLGISTGLPAQKSPSNKMITPLTEHMFSQFSSVTPAANKPGKPKPKKKKNPKKAAQKPAAIKKPAVNSK